MKILREHSTKLETQAEMLRTQEKIPATLKSLGEDFIGPDRAGPKEIEEGSKFSDLSRVRLFLRFLLGLSVSNRFSRLT